MPAPVRPQLPPSAPEASPAGRRAVVAWCLYDWAHSAFDTVVITFVFATYFVRAVAPDPVSGTAAWATAQAAAGLIIAVASAPLGAIADRGGRRRAFLGACTALMVVASAGLWFVGPRPEDARLALALVAAATVGSEIATVFYNAMLPDLTRPERLGRVSGLAWGLGYAGGIVALGLCLLVLINPHPPPFGLAGVPAGAVRAATLFSAGWIALFAWPVLVFGPTDAHRTGWRLALRQGLPALWATLRTAAADRTLRRFLVARMLYTDGLTTLFAFGGIFAAGTFGMGTHEVLLLGIGLNVTAGIGALGFALVQDRMGDRATVLLSLAALAGLGTAVLLARTAAAFWPLALALGVFVGPAQAASRSLMARLAPAETRNAHFGLYALSGRVTGFIGPAALGVVTAAFASQRAGMAVIVLLLAAGGMLLAATPIAAKG